MSVSIRLFDTANMPRPRALDVPRAFYQVTDLPAPLAGMPAPSQGLPWADLRQHGFRHVVCLNSESPAYEPAPLSILAAMRLEDLVHGGEPTDPVRETDLVTKAVELVTARLSAGEGVVVHCHGGTGRSGTVIGCALVSFGLLPTCVIRYLNTLNQRRGRAGWPEAPFQSRLLRMFSGGN